MDVFTFFVNAGITMNWETLRSNIKRFGIFPILFASFLPFSTDAGDFAMERNSMVDNQIIARGIKDPRVLKALRETPRHLFVPLQNERAYGDHPLPIGEGQTISQPYIVALMTELLKLKGTEKILEIGTGSGYQAAVLSPLCKEVYTIEIKKVLFNRTAPLLKKLGYDNVHPIFGDGYFGLEKKAPFDAIIITAAANHIPPPLVAQLKDGGKLVLPLNTNWLFQTLVVVTKEGGDIKMKNIASVNFVPMTGRMLD